MSTAASLSKTSGNGTENEHEEANGESRFSNDDLDTEIEVAPENENETKKKRKTKRKSKNEADEDEDPDDEKERKKRERRRKRKEEKGEANGEVSPPAYEEVEDPGPKKRKTKNIKAKMSNLVDTPLLFAAGIFVCVLLPFSIYACDVIISVNVIDTDVYRNTIISNDNDFALLPRPEKLTGKKYEMQDTIFMAIQINTRTMRERRTRSVPDEPILVEQKNSTDLNTSTMETILSTTTQQLSQPTESTQATPATSPTPSTHASSTSTLAVKFITLSNTTKISNTTTPTANATIDENSNVNTTAKPRKVKTKPPKVKLPTVRIITTSTPSTTTGNTTVMDPEPWKQQPGEFCKGLYYFYEHHISYALEHGSDWMNDQTSSVYSKEQALFFMFTVFGVIFLLSGLALRCDIFLNDEWSSFLLLNFLLYSISMALTASVFGQESTNDGLRCATCRFTVNCSDIDPWNYNSHWPAKMDDKWALVALLSFVLKFADCITMAIVTLKFIVDSERDLWWATCLKIFGWLIVFPVLIFTPMLGVIRYQVLPGTLPHDEGAMMGVQVIFYIGVAFWALSLAALPFFCKMRMCSGSADQWDEDEDEDY